MADAACEYYGSPPAERWIDFAGSGMVLVMESKKRGGEVALSRIERPLREARLMARSVLSEGSGRRPRKKHRYPSELRRNLPSLPPMNLPNPLPCYMSGIDGVFVLERY